MEIASYIAEPEFWTITLFLFCLGSILKYRTPLENHLISLILFLVSVLLFLFEGTIHSTVIGAQRLTDILVMYGLVRGLSSAAIATWSWDTGHGVFKFINSRKQKKNDERFTEGN